MPLVVYIYLPLSLFFNLNPYIFPTSTDPNYIEEIISLLLSAAAIYRFGLLGRALTDSYDPLTYNEIRC